MYTYQCHLLVCTKNGVEFNNLVTVEHFISKLQRNVFVWSKFTAIKQKFKDNLLCETKILLFNSAVLGVDTSME